MEYLLLILQATFRVFSGYFSSPPITIDLQPFQTLAGLITKIYTGWSCHAQLQSFMTSKYCEQFCVVHYHCADWLAKKKKSFLFLCLFYILYIILLTSWEIFNEKLEWPSSALPVLILHDKENHPLLYPSQLIFVEVNKKEEEIIVFNLNAMDHL